jgi:hypothetical protein
MRPQRDFLRGFVLTLAAAGMITIWLPLVRGLMDGATYSWGGFYFGMFLRGSGLGGDYWKLLLVAALALTALWYGWRGSRLPAHLIVLAWVVPWAVGAVYMAVTDPGSLRFRGETLGVDISLAVAGPVLFTAVALLAAWWLVRDLRARGPRFAPPWTRTNTILLALVLGMLPLQFVLLRFGQPHGATDAIGVLLTMLQWVLLNVAFAKGARRAPAAVGG